jgi:hypothetical protein
MQEWIYINNEDNTSRYVLGTKGDKPVFCFGINPSTAEPDNLDPTLRSVSAISSSNGYDSWIMFNVYPKRDTVFDDIDKVIQDEEHTKNVNAIIETISKYDEVDIWVAFGNHIYGRTYMSYCLKDIYDKLSGIKINWLSIGVNKSGAPKHPLYQKSTSQLVSFDMNAYINTLK